MKITLELAQEIGFIPSGYLTHEQKRHYKVDKSYLVDINESFLTNSTKEKTMKRPKLNIKNGIYWTLLLLIFLSACGVVAVGMLRALGK